LSSRFKEALGRISPWHTHIAEGRGSRTNMDPACNKRSFVCNKGGTRTAREIYATICPFGQHACVVDRAPHLISLHLHLVLRNHHAVRNVKVSKGGFQSLGRCFLSFCWFFGSLFDLQNATVEGGECGFAPSQRESAFLYLILLRGAKSRVRSTQTTRLISWLALFKDERTRGLIVGIPFTLFL